MDLTYRGTVANPMNKKDVAGFRLSGEIKRSDFGIGTKFPEPMIGETVTITADGEFGHD
jgi:polyisoprenoid-binding protein YceI